MLVSFGQDGGSYHMREEEERRCRVRNWMGVLCMLQPPWSKIFLFLLVDATINTHY